MKFILKLILLGAVTFWISLWGFGTLAELNKESVAQENVFGGTFSERVAAGGLY